MNNDYFIEGIRAVKNYKGYGEAVFMDSASIDYCAKVVKKYKVRSLVISAMYFRENNIDFLARYDFSCIENVKLLMDLEDLTPLYTLKGLKDLSLSYVPYLNHKSLFDFSSFPYLETLEFEWERRRFINLNRCTSLKSLRMVKFSEEDLSLLLEIKLLEKLQLFYTGIKSLNGIQSLTHLTLIEIETARKLENIGAITVNHKESLRKLFIYGAPKLTNIDALKNQDQLEMLQLVKTGELESIRFIDGFKNLTMFGFNAKVKDGDKSPLKRFPPPNIPPLNLVR